jgi:hypothetical protein
MLRAWMSFLWSFGSLSKDAWLFSTWLAYFNTISPSLAVKRATSHCGLTTVIKIEQFNTQPPLIKGPTPLLLGVEGPYLAMCPGA